MDWQSVAGSQRRDLMIRRDGTLWGRGYLPKVLFGNRCSTLYFQQPPQIGSRTNWSQIFGEGDSFVAITKSHSLIKNDIDLFSKTLGQPSRYSDWIAADVSWYGLLALASDGTMCFWQETRGGGANGPLLAPTHRPFWSLNLLTDSKH